MRFLPDDSCPDGVPASPAAAPREVLILGLTVDGRLFRPGDWAERLAGAMSCFHPGGAQGGRHPVVGQTPYCVARMVDGVKCVAVSEALREAEPMAWDFVMNFARDNGLRVANGGGPPP